MARACAAVWWGTHDTGAKTNKGCICQRDWALKGAARCTNDGNLGCCNPDKDAGGPWCFLAKGCSATSRTYDYCSGSQTTSFESLGDHNACRNPDGDTGKLWCYVAENEWQYCEPLGTPAPGSATIAIGRAH